MFKQSNFARGAVTLSFAGAASLAFAAAADANLVHPGRFALPASRATVKQPYFVKVRNGPRVTSALLVLGGGATLPAIAYTGIGSVTTNPSVPGRGDHTVFGEWLAETAVAAGGYTISYCQTGSGGGKGVMNGNYGVDTPLGSYGSCPASDGLAKTQVDLNNGFDATTTQTDTADFAGSDAPVAQSEYSPLGLHFPVRGEFVQIPFMAGSVALAFNNSSGFVHGKLRLTVSEICHIADGEVTNWDQIPKAADSGATGLPSTASPVNPENNSTNPGFSPQPMTFVYRSDNSGTTFAFTNFLSAADGTASPGTRTHCGGTGETWGLNQDFLSALPKPSGATQGTNFVGEKGNTNVLHEIATTTGAIGYGETANALADSADKVAFASIYTVPVIPSSDPNAYLKSPTTDLPAAANDIVTFTKDKTPILTCGNRTNDTSNFNCTAAGTIVGRPLPSALTPVAGDYKPNCLGVVDPSTYATPVSGYPIVAVTNLEFYSSGNGIYTYALRALAETVEDYKNGTAALPLNGFGSGLTISTIDKSAPYSTATPPAGKTGFSTLNVSDTYYSNAAVGIATNCIN